MNSKKKVNIAIAGELAPVKTIIPVIQRLKELDSQDKLNFKISKITGLYHGDLAKDLLNPFCDELFSIGEGRRGVKKSNVKLAFLIIKDIFKAFTALKGKNIDLLITAGNAGDVRKSIVAANILRIPILHIEQDIYNPIEVISHANLVTAPSKEYKSYLEDNYSIKNVVNINGYPMAKYVNDYVNGGNLKSIDDLYNEYFYNGDSSKRLFRDEISDNKCEKDNEDEIIDNKSIMDSELFFGDSLSVLDDFTLVVLGGDLKEEDIEPLIQSIEKLELNILIAPYRFDRSYVESLISLDNIIVLPQYVDLLSLMNFASSLIYAAGMGMTIEAGVFNIPSLKIRGFHKTHGSVDLAESLGISIVDIDDIPNAFKTISSPNQTDLLKNSEIAISKLVEIINNFNSNDLSKSGFKSTKYIWDSRKVFR